MWASISVLLSLVLLWLQHIWDPKNIELLEKKAKEEKNEKVKQLLEQAIADRSTLNLSALISAGLSKPDANGMPSQPGDSHSSGQPGDLFGTKLPGRSDDEIVDIPRDKPETFQPPQQ